ncbi:MAG: metal-dependent transcriptional regulator [Candidatus Thermoplasmatota archaeon]|jgi:DtxR family Mn-dependent transcriptional regulator|nr:metal-dependent transcriptional regulator [Candidatus Thermoplasmatota archaeon]MCL5785995.1 metal-dependent transcriptional regulator [Candidatus Thermoplasmatota archaeon]
MEILQKLTKKQLVALQTVEMLQKGKKGISLLEIAASLRVKPPSALETLRVLQTLGLVTRISGKTKLTRLGSGCLAEYTRHHRIAECVFSSYLSAEESHRAAIEIDMSLSHETVEELCAAEGHPKMCPHGFPIPPCDADAGSA